MNAFLEILEKFSERIFCRTCEVVSAIYFLERMFVAEELQCKKYIKHWFITQWANDIKRVA